MLLLRRSDRESKVLIRVSVWPILTTHIDTQHTHSLAFILIHLLTYFLVHILIYTMSATHCLSGREGPRYRERSRTRRSHGNRNRRRSRSDSPTDSVTQRHQSEADTDTGTDSETEQEWPSVNPPITTPFRTQSSPTLAREIAIVTPTPADTPTREYTTRSRHRMVDLEVSTAIWNQAREIFRCKLLTIDPFPMNCNYLAEASFLEAREEIQAEAEQITKRAIYMVKYPLVVQHTF
jgi:hypothetical protein